MSESLVTQIMFDPARGASAFALAETFANSSLVPAHLQGRPGDCFIALTMAAELRQTPLMVMQNIVIVQGTAGWKAQYVIALANNSGLFRDRIDWKVERMPGRTKYQRKTKGGMVEASMENMRVTAFATLAGTGARVEFSVDTEMAIGEGWANNEKYTTMPEVMLRYRAGAFLVRFYAADVMLGLYTDAELETMPVAETVEVIQSPVTRPTGRAALGIGSPAQTVAMPDPVAERVVVEVSEPTLTPLQAKAAAAVEAAKLTPEDIAHVTGGKPAHEWDTAALKALSAIVQAKKAAATPTDSDEVPL